MIAWSPKGLVAVGQSKRFIEVTVDIAGRLDLLISRLSQDKVERLW
jgi:hypothetical protein